MDEDFKLGAILSPPDSRDKTLSDFIPNIKTRAPHVSEFSISKHPNVRHQKNTSQCVAFSLAKIKEIQEYHETGVYEELSPSFIYLYRDLTYQGEGMVPRLALKQLNKFGVCRNELLPELYNYSDKDKLSEKEYAKLLIDAYGRKISGYARLYSFEDVATYLKQYDTPVLVVISIGISFYMKDPITNIVHDADPEDKIKGLHGSIITGFKTIGGMKYYEIQNSYGDNWGNNGYFYIKVNSNLIKEMWAVMDTNPIQEEKLARELLFEINKKSCTIDGKPTLLNNPVKQIDNTIYLPIDILTRFIGYDYTEDADKRVKLKKGGETKFKK